MCDLARCYFNTNAFLGVVDREKRTPAVLLAIVIQPATSGISQSNRLTMQKPVYVVDSVVT